jgi:ABC-type uncharacterized transport system fused permease/ATPase subunit
MNSKFKEIPDAEQFEQSDNTEWFSLDDLMNFDREHDPDCLIGNRLICRGGSFILQGYTGFGKSSLALQLAMCWAYVLGSGARFLRH